MALAPVGRIPGDQVQISCVAKAAGKAAGQVIGEGDGLSLRNLKFTGLTHNFKLTQQLG